jgi:hypothetical protein
MILSDRVDRMVGEMNDLAVPFVFFLRVQSQGCVTSAPPRITEVCDPRFPFDYRDCRYPWIYMSQGSLIYLLSLNPVSWLDVSLSTDTVFDLTMQQSGKLDRDDSIVQSHQYSTITIKGRQAAAV